MDTEKRQWLITGCNNMSADDDKCEVHHMTLFAVGFFLIV